MSMPTMPPQGPPQQPPQGPPQGDPSQDPAIQRLIQALQGNPLLNVFLAILADDPEMARKIAVLAETPERGGIQAVLALLQEVQQQVPGLGQGGAPDEQGPEPPPGAPTPGGPEPMGPEPGEPPAQPPMPMMQGRNDGPEPPQPGAMVPAGPQQPVPQGPQQPMPMPGGPANAHPASMQTLLADLSPDLSKIVRELNPDQQQKVLGLYQERGLQAVEALLRQLQAARQAQEGPQQAPGGPPNAPKTPKTPPEKPKKKRDKSTPNFELDPLPQNKWGDKGPSYATVVRHQRKAKELWQPRDIRIQEDVDLYNLSRKQIEGIPMGPRPHRAYNSAEGDIVHVSSRPFQFVERVTSYCTPTGERAPQTDCPPWADDDDTINASQALEDWLTYGRDLDEQIWFRKGANGDPRMPLPRVEAGGMALLGGAGFQVKFDPRSKQRPIKMEYIPINRLYPLPGVAMIYSETLPLADARGAWPEINEYYEKYDNTDQAPDEKMQVTVGAWTDVYDEGQGGLWHAIFWVTGGSNGGSWGDEAEDQRAKWIKKPTRIDFGFSPYQYVIWGGAPYYATQGVDDYERFRGMGCLTMLRRTFKLMDLLWSATATGAIKAVDPAIVQYYIPGTDKKQMKRYRTGAGQTNYAIVGEKVEPLLWTVAGSPDGQAILNALWQEVSDMDSPLLKGMGNAQSGYQQQVQQSAAGNVAVNPIIDALERMYQLQNTLRIELLIRKGVDDDEITKLPYPSRPVDDQFDAIYPTFKSLTPEMAKLNGTRSVVTIKRLTLMEEQVLWNMLGQAVQSKMINARDAMKRMGITNPQRNLLRILQEAAVMDPNALKAMMGAAIMGGDNALFQIGWQQVLQSQAQGGPGGPPQAAPTGIPSAIAPTGGPGGAPPAAMQGMQ